ncbi:acetyl-CoA C-acyltransferase [Corynebacterium lubricantis]|uniref:acetyl-CoA C-acyltransferase n=1 Tax=Corynebacterium lubricantis TaxID=541095 RepID=UPI00037CE401|nr:acetyl-CoA C-acyltransferase [Corynebacterium lubricantis]
MQDIYIVNGARTAIGTFMGTLSNETPISLGTIVAKEAMSRAGVDPAAVDSSNFANIVISEPRDLYTSRVVGLDAGLPQSSHAVGVNRLCGSGVQAIVTSAQNIMTGDSELAIAGGTEIMSKAIYSVRGMRKGQKMGPGKLDDWLTGALSDPMGHGHMGITAEHVAEKYGLSRERQDEFALLSQTRAAAAIEAGRFKDQIVPVTVKGRKGDVVFDTDEHPRASSMESLAKLPAAFQEGGSVTAGNASGMNDAAAAVVVASQTAVDSHGLEPMARIVSWGFAGVDPKYMGCGPIEAVPRALAKAGLKLDDIDLIESNEAFAAQALAVQDGLGLDPEKTNVDGGAISLGHPIGATGAILTVKVIHRLKADNLRYGLVTMCIGGGQGIALIVEV